MENCIGVKRMLKQLLCREMKHLAFSRSGFPLRGRTLVESKSPDLELSKPIFLFSPENSFSVVIFVSSLAQPLLITVKLNEVEEKVELGFLVSFYSLFLNRQHSQTDWECSRRPENQEVTQTCLYPSTWEPLESDPQRQ